MRAFYLHISILLSSFLCSGEAQSEWFTDTQGIMGTEVSVTLWHDNTTLAKTAADAVMSEMRRLDEALSPYISSSELSQVNKYAFKQDVLLSDELALLIDKSLYFSVISDGAFDITFASLAQHYDYREEKQPSSKLIEAVLPAINYKWLAFDRTKKTLRFKHEKVQIDLGGIAKGYAVDRAIVLLKEKGIRHASVSAGGDSRILGDRRGRPWVIGIKNPRVEQGANVSEQDEAVLRIPLEDVALSTSGDYERYFIDDQTGMRVHHIINPRTGRSANEVMSVTILGDNGLDTDPLSTTIFVLGIERGMNLVNKLTEFDAIVIDIKGKVHYSNGLAAQ